MQLQMRRFARGKFARNAFHRWRTADVPQADEQYACIEGRGVMPSSVSSGA